MSKSEKQHAVRETLRNYFADYNFFENFRDLHTNLRGDILAGITVAMVILPMALAFGVASGLGASAGLWAAIAAGLIAGPLSGFRWSVGGPTGPMTIQLLAILALYPGPDGKPDLQLATASVVLAGVMLIALGAFKLGRFIRYTPYPVVSGFMTGLGLIYIILQINPFFGIASASSIKDALFELPMLMQDMQTGAVVVGGVALGATLAWAKWVKVAWLPAPLIGLIAGVAVAALPGIEAPMIGAVPTGLPSLHVPDYHLVNRAFVPAATLAALCVFDSLLTALIIDNLTSTRHNSDRELVAQGAANIASGLVGGIGSATNTMPCVVAVKSGAKTRMATIVMGLVLLGLALGLGPLAAYVPMPALAAILIKAGWDIIDLRILPVVRALPRSDKLAFGLVVAATVGWDLLSAMALGLAVAFFRFVKDSADRYERALDERAEQLAHERDEAMEVFLDRYEFDDLSGLAAEKGIDLTDRATRARALHAAIRERLELLRPHGPLFFGAVSWLQDAVQELRGKDVLLVDCGDLDSIDLSGAYAFADLVAAAQREGLLVIISGLPPATERVLDDLDELDMVPEDCRFTDFDEALFRAIGEIEARTHRRRLTQQGHRPSPPPQPMQMGIVGSA
jgi:SulP family sulfate permease